MRDLKDPVASRKLKLYERLREAGLIPNNVIDLQIDIPLDGAVTITCKYFADEAIDGPAISEAMVNALKAPQATGMIPTVAHRQNIRYRPPAPDDSGAEGEEAAV